MTEAAIFHSAPIFDTLPTHPSVHASTVEALPGGDLLAAFYAGTVEKAKDITIFQTRYLSSEARWTPPEIAVADADFSLGNPVLFMAPDDVLWLYYLVMRGDKWYKCTLHAKTSRDLGRTWQHAQDFPASLGWTIRNNLILLDSSEILFPLCDESKGFSFFMASKDYGQTWEIRGRVTSDPKNLQPAVIQRSSGELLTLIRTGGKGGRCWESHSSDMGKTWTKAVPGPFKNPNAALAMIRLESGHVAAVYNDSDQRKYRTPLAISLSEDEGRTWPHTRILEDAPGEFTYRTDREDNWDSVEFSYPAMTQTWDGLIHITYTHDHRRNIKHAVCNEVWLKGGDQ